MPVAALYGEEAGGQEDASSQVLALLGEQGAVSLLQAYAAIQDAQLRRDVLAVVRSAARIGMGEVQGMA